MSQSGAIQWALQNLPANKPHSAPRDVPPSLFDQQYHNTIYAALVAASSDRIAHQLYLADPALLPAWCEARDTLTRVGVLAAAAEASGGASFNQVLDEIELRE